MSDPTLEILLGLKEVPAYIILGFALYRTAPKIWEVWLNERKEERKEKKEERQAFRQELREITQALVNHDQLTSDRLSALNARLSERFERTHGLIRNLATGETPDTDRLMSRDIPKPSGKAAP